MSIAGLELRIGAKLAISAGVGVVLVGIMLGTQKMGGGASPSGAYSNREVSKPRHSVTHGDTRKVVYDWYADS